MDLWEAYEETSACLADPDEPVLINLGICTTSIDDIERLARKMPGRHIRVLPYARLSLNAQETGPGNGTVTVLRGFDITRPEYATLIPSEAIQVLQDVMEYGAQKGKSGWRELATTEHLLHAMIHIFLHMAEDRDEPHLRHAFTRLMMAVCIDEGRNNGARTE